LGKELFLFFLLLIELFPPPCKAQVNVSVPVLFDQFTHNYYLLNPANSDSTYKLMAKTGNKSQSGLFQGVSALYIDGDLKIKTNRKEVFHFLGVQFINSKEGDFINQSRVYGRYSWRTNITSRSSLSAGLALGFVNYSFKSSQAGVGGSAFTPDGSAGIWYLRDQFGAGFAVQQMFKGKLQPVNQFFVLDRYYNLTIYKILPISTFVNFNTHFYAQFEKEQAVNLSLTGLVDLYEKLEFGINYRYLKGIAFVGGLKKIHIASSALSLYFSYLSRTGKISINDNAVELFLSLEY